MTDPLALGAAVAYCGWDPTTLVSDETVYCDGDGTTILQLPSLYVTAVTAVTVTDQYSATYQASIDTPGTASRSDVGWSENGILTWHPAAGSPYAGWPVGEQNIAVTYSGGYNAAPADLQAAIDHLSARLPDMVGASSKRLGSAAIAYAQSIADGGLLLIEQMVLDRYRIPRAR